MRVLIVVEGTHSDDDEEDGDDRKKTRAVVITAVSLAISVLAVLGVRAVIAQDTGEAKYNVRVPNGLAFSEFRGYEAWQTVSISHNDKVMALTLANPVMINAFKSGIPANGKPFPDGSLEFETARDAAHGHGAGQSA